LRHEVPAKREAPMTDQELRGAWKKFSRGDGLTIQEIRALKKQVTQALPYLQGRVAEHGNLVRRDANNTLDRLTQFEEAIKKRPRI
jgi:hypothetical protein